MKNVIYIFTFFVINTFFSLSQDTTNCYSVSTKDTNNSTISNLYFKLVKKGYLVPKFRIEKKESSYLIEICPGQKYTHVVIKSNTGIKTNYSPSEFGNSIKNQFNQLINNGFPFSKLKFDSIYFQKTIISGSLIVEKGPFFQWGKILIKGNSSINEQILRGILDIKSGEPFSEQTFRNIENKINQLPYLANYQKPEILFENGKVDLYLYLNSKPINNISGTVGIQQNTTTQKYFLIGDLRMKLVNQLKRGESIDFQWRRIQEATQSLKIGLNYPSLFKSNFGVDNQFSLYKKDSTFLELKNQLGIQYFANGGYILKANYKFLESNTLNNTSNNSLMGNSTNYFYGLSISKQRLDYIPAPTKGFQFMIDVSFGRRTTSRTDSLKNKFDNTFKSEYQFSNYFSLFKRHVIKTQFSGEIYLAPYYYQNELIRFGGLMNQRGFREDELLGNIRFTQSIEYRFMIERNSFLFTYYDISYYENRVKNLIHDTPYGFGAGLSFGTQQGIFSISYAIGKQFNNPVLLKNGIIHFGYISYF